MITFHEVFFLVAASALCAILIVHFLKKSAWLLGFIDVPNERSCHKRPTPRGGGLGICVITLIGGVIVLVTGLCPGGCQTLITPFYIGALILAIVGLLDDRKPLPRWIRLSVHCFVAIIIVQGYGYMTSLTLPIWGKLSLPRVGFAITILWIVGLINTFNFMDGIDGIAAGQAIVSALGWLVIATMIHEPWIALLAAILIGSSLGFLYHNWAPASIFMGDVGSTFFGYTFAVIPLMVSSTGVPSKSTILFIGALLVWPFIFDSLFTFFRRLLNGENVFQSHRSHIYQHFIMQGYRTATISTVYIIIGATGPPMAIFWLSGSTWSRIPIITALLVLCSALVIFWTKLQAGSGASGAKPPIWIPKVSNLLK